MEKLINFITSNYLWFLISSLIVIFALIGYLVDMTNHQRPKKEPKKSPKKEQEKNI